MHFLLFMTHTSFALQVRHVKTPVITPQWQQRSLRRVAATSSEDECWVSKPRGSRGHRGHASSPCSISDTGRCRSFTSTAPLSWRCSCWCSSKVAMSPRTSARSSSKAKVRATVTHEITSIFCNYYWNCAGNIGIVYPNGRKKRNTSRMSFVATTSMWVFLDVVTKEPPTRERH